jgi:hypothetical protein
MLSRQEEERERREVLANDRRVREQGQAGTFLSHTHSDAGGRFAAVGAATVIGSKADVAAAYPAASAAHQTELPPENPLGYSVEAMTEPSLEQPSSFTAQATGEPTAPSSTIPLIDDVERVGSPLSPEPMAAQRMSQMSSSSARADDVRTGRPPHRRY